MSIFKLIFLTETNCKIRQLQKKKVGYKNVWKFVPLGGGGGGRRLTAKSILNFHFDYLNPSLRETGECFLCH